MCNLNGRRDEMRFNENELYDIATIYLPREGDFALALADAYLKADADNQRKIEDAFGDLFTTAYDKWAPGSCISCGDDTDYLEQHYCNCCDPAGFEGDDLTEGETK
jgi:hypothetical protein